MTSGPSSNWFALRKSLPLHGHPRKRRMVEGVSRSNEASAFPRDFSSKLQKRRDSDLPNEHVDLETTEVKNGESITTLRKMVLGKLEYSASYTAPGNYLALDCEMVGVGIDGNESSLARVSIVNYTGAIILDVYVRQRERVVDYRTRWSGVRSTDLGGSAKPFKEVQKTVADLIKDRILIGHAIYNDLKALLLSHPSPQIRDTQSLAYKHRVVKSRRPALRVLVKQELGIVIQSSEHNSVTDARATMALFRLYKKQWEGGFRPIHKVAQPRSRNKDPAGKANTLTPRPPPSASSPVRGRKRKHSDASEVGDDDADGVSEPSSPPSRARTHSPSPSSRPSTRSLTQHTSTLPPRRKQRSRWRPPPDSAQRQVISSGISTIIRRAGGIKEVQRKGKDSIVRSDAKGGKKSGKAGEEWWKTLGGGKKGSINR